MSKRIAFMVAGLSLAFSSAGCCCLSGMGYNKCQPCGGCPTGGGAYYAPQSTMVQSLDAQAYSSGYTTQTATVSGATIGAPIMASPGYTTQTVLVPQANMLPF